MVDTALRSHPARSGKGSPVLAGPGGRTLAVLALACSLTAMGLSGCAGLRRTLPTPTARVAGVGIEDLTLYGLTLRLDVEVRNPYGPDLPLLGAEYALATSGTPLLSGVADVGGTVPGRGKRTVPVPVRLSFGGLVELASAIAPGALVPYEADLTLAVDAPVLGRMSLPLHHEDRFPVPALPEVAVTGVHWEGLSATRATGRVDLRIENPNAYGVDLRRLAYSLELAGFEVANGSISERLALAAGESGAAAVGISFSPLQVGAALYETLSGGKTDYRLRGSVDVNSTYGPLAGPFEAEGSVPFTR